MYPFTCVGRIEPYEIVELRLTQAQKDFLDEYEIIISDAYIGLLRVYKDNKVIWQTPFWDALSSLEPGMDGEKFDKWMKSNDESLRKQLHNWLDNIMKLPQEELNQIFLNNIHLFNI